MVRTFGYCGEAIRKVEQVLSSGTTFFPVILSIDLFTMAYCRTENVFEQLLIKILIYYISDYFLAVSLSSALPIDFHPLVHPSLFLLFLPSYTELEVKTKENLYLF